MNIRICLLSIQIVLWGSVYSYEQLVMVYQNKGISAVKEYIHHNNINLALQDKNGKLPLSAIINYRMSKDDCEQLALCLLESGAPCNAYSLGYTPLYCACKNNYKKIINELLRRGADCNAVQADGHTPFSLFCEKFDDDCYDVLHQCIAYGADIQKVVKLARGSRTPLMLLVMQRHFESIKCLLEYGADVTAICDSVTALSQAVNLGVSKNIKDLLLRYGALTDGINSKDPCLLLKNGIPQDFCIHLDYMFICLRTIALDKNIAFNKKHFFWTYCVAEKNVKNRVQFFAHAVATSNDALAQEILHVQQFLPEKVKVLDVVSSLLYKKIVMAYCQEVFHEQLFKNAYIKDCVFIFSPQ